MEIDFPKKFNIYFSNCIFASFGRVIPNSAHRALIMAQGTAHGMHPAILSAAFK
jgi:hypothetical protein